MDLTTGISQLIASRVLEVPSEPVQKLRRLIAAECICNFHVHFFFGCIILVSWKIFSVNRESLGIWTSAQFVGWKCICINEHGS